MTDGKAAIGGEGGASGDRRVEYKLQRGANEVEAALGGPRWCCGLKKEGLGRLLLIRLVPRDRKILSCLL